MEYINLGEITEAHLHGTWKVESRSLNNKNESENIFVSYNSIEFLENNDFIALNGKNIQGQWQIIREHEVIYNPQIKFYLNDKQAVNSIITNLMADNDVFKLVLYFDSGLECVLAKSK